MHNQFEKLIGAIRQIRLGESERERVGKTIMEYTKHFPVPAQTESAETRQAFYPLYMKYMRYLRHAIPLALVVIALVFGVRGSSVPITVSDMGAPSLSDNVSEESGSFEAALKNSVGIEEMYRADTQSGVAQDTMPSFDEPIYYGDPISDLSDTREFLKIDYSSRIQTRDVEETVRDVEDVVRSVSGRIDQMESGERWGRVSFVVAKTDFYELKSKLGEITYTELYTENISAQNLLGQKQNIEERTADSLDRLELLEGKKAALDSTHTKRISVLRTEIAAAEDELASVRSAKKLVDEDSAVFLQLTKQETALIQKITTLNQEEVRENNTYANENRTIRAQIENTKSNLENLAEEDVQFTNTVETVRGHVDVVWISLWDLGEAFSPTPMWLNIVILGVLLWWYLGRVTKNFANIPTV